MTAAWLIRFAVFSAALALGACSGDDRSADKIAARIAADAKGAVAERGIPPDVGFDLKVGAVSLEPTGSLVIEQRFCIFKDALGPCDGDDGWRRFEIRVDPEMVDEDAIGVDKVAPGWGDGLVVVLPYRKDSACIAGPGEPDKDRAPADFINHGVAAAAADMWAMTVVSSRHGSDNKIDPNAKNDPFQPVDPDYARRFEAASPETGPAAIPCPSQETCARIAKNARRLIAIARERKEVFERALVKPSVDLTDLAKDIEADETRTLADAEIKNAPKPLEPVDIDVMPKPAARDGSVDEILARVNAAIKGQDILFTMQGDTALRLRNKAPAFVLKDGVLIYNGNKEGASPYAVDLTRLGEGSVGAPTPEDGGADLDYRGVNPPKKNSHYVRLAGYGILPLPNSDGPPINAKLTDITFECGTKAACEAFADDLRALIAAVKATRAYGVDIAGLWELYAPSPTGGFSRWVLDFRRDGSYVFTDESNGASHAGRYNSSAGKWSLSGKWTKNPLLAPGTPFDDDGAYRLIAADTLELKGRYGAGVWRREEGHETSGG